MHPFTPLLGPLGPPLSFFSPGPSLAGPYLRIYGCGPIKICSDGALTPFPFSSRSIKAQGDSRPRGNTREGGREEEIKDTERSCEAKA